MAEETTIRRYSIDKVGAVMSSALMTDSKLTDSANVNAQMSRSVNEQFKIGIDFVLFNDQKDVCLESKFRNISILFEGMVGMMDLDYKEATRNFNYVISLLVEADMAYDASENTDVVRSIVYFNIVRDIYEARMDAEDLKKTIQTKQEAKNAAKKTVKNKWFKIGKMYSLRKLDLNGNIKDVHVFRCVKFIYSVGNNPVNCVIMQKIGDPLVGNARTLSRMDCRMWHIKYSPDLYMFSMNHRFYPASDKEIAAATEEIGRRQEQEHLEKIHESQDKWAKEINGNSSGIPSSIHQVHLKTVYE